MELLERAPGLRLAGAELGVSESGLAVSRVGSRLSVGGGVTVGLAVTLVLTATVGVEVSETVTLWNMVGGPVEVGGAVVGGTVVGGAGKYAAGSLAVSVVVAERVVWWRRVGRYLR